MTSVYSIFLANWREPVDPPLPGLKYCIPSPIPPIRPYVFQFSFPNELDQLILTCAELTKNESNIYICMMFRKKTLLTCSEGQDWCTFQDSGVGASFFLRLFANHHTHCTIYWLLLNKCVQKVYALFFTQRFSLSDLVHYLLFLTLLYILIINNNREV